MNQRGAFVITGAGSGLGATLAHEIYRSGFSVALVGRTKSKLEATKKNIESTVKGQSGIISIHVMDLTQEASVQVGFREIRSIHGAIACLVNNAGTWTGGKKIVELSNFEIQKSLELNFYSAVNATRAMLENRKIGMPMSIINIGATSSLQGWANVAAFCIGKGALRIFSQSLAREMGPQGVHVAHLVIDGLIDNERTRNLNPDTPEANFMKMESIAKTILHLAIQEKSCWTFELDMRPSNENW